VNEAARLREGVTDPQFGDLPLVVLSSRAFGDRWVEMERQMLQRSTNSSFVQTDTTAHNIHMRHPDLVVKTVERVVQAVREQPAARGRP
jgi:hypothetical protein